MRYSILVLAFIAFSCKSTKKNIVEVNRVNEELITANTRTINTDLGNVSKKTIITEVIKESFEKVDGSQEIKPVKVVTITTEIEETEKKNFVTESNSLEESIKKDNLDSLILNKETEGMEVVEEIIGGVTGAFIGNFTK